MSLAQWNYASLNGFRFRKPYPFTAIPQSGNRINLAWGNVDADNYVLDCSLDNIFFSNIYIGANQTFSHSGLTINTFYYYRIKGQKAGYPDSPYSLVNATTLVGDLFLGENEEDFGDSQMVGQGSTTGNSFRERINTYLQSNAISHAAGGSGVYHLAKSANEFINENTSGFLMSGTPGFNDRRYAGSNSQTDEKIDGAYRIFIMNCFAKNYHDSSSFFQTGTWTGIGTSFGTKFPALNNTGPATLTKTISGKHFGISLLGSSGGIYTFGTLQILVDGVEVFNSSMNNKSDGVEVFGNDNHVCPYGILILGLTDGPHTFELISTDSTPVDFVAELVDPGIDYSNTVIVLGIPDMPARGYLVEPANATPELLEADRTRIKNIIDNVSPFLPIRYVETKDILDLDTMYDLDGVHWNDLGHDAIYNEIKSQIAINNSYRLFNQMVKMVYFNGFYQSRSNNTWESFALSNLYLPSGIDGHVEAEVREGDWGMFGLNSTPTLELYSGYEYAAACYAGSIWKLTDGLFFTQELAGPLAYAGKIRLGRFGGIIKIQYAADGVTFSDVYVWGADAGAYYLNLDLEARKKVFGLTTSGFISY
jgi:hypothetical protein